MLKYELLHDCNALTGISRDEGLLRTAKCSDRAERRMLTTSSIYGATNTVPERLTKP